MEEREISKAVIKRLPRYYRYLGEIMESGVERMHVTASQIRQDLNNFGGFGQQGYGYNVAHLYEEIGKILGLDKQYNMIIVGGGNLGQALANYVSFEKRGFVIKGIFDVNPVLKGLSVQGGGDGGTSGKIRSQSHLEFCPCGSAGAGGCFGGECPSVREPDAAVLQH